MGRLLGIQPWDDKIMTQDLLQMLPGLPREPLGSIRPPDTPGAYVHFLATEREFLADVFGVILTRGRYPFYVGSGRSLRERMNRYRVALRHMPLDEGELWVAVLPCDSYASALYAESALISGLSPVIMNSLKGFGSKRPGRHRKEQKVSPADCILRHSWAPEATLFEQARARVKVAAILAAGMPNRPRWPPLFPASASSGTTPPGQGQPGLRLLRGGPQQP